jgi:hypothetical protein
MKEATRFDFPGRLIRCDLQSGENCMTSNHNLFTKLSGQMKVDIITVVLPFVAAARLGSLALEATL